MKFNVESSAPRQNATSTRRTTISARTARPVPISGRQVFRQNSRRSNRSPNAAAWPSETRFRSFPVYQTFYANFSILFVVEGSNVFVITVRHRARKRMTRDEVDERV